MKKILLFLITLFIGCNVYALDLQVSNPNGIKLHVDREEIVIPYQSTVKLIDEPNGSANVLVEYNGESVSVRKSDLKVLSDTFKDVDGIELTSEETVKVFSKNGLEIYKGPSKTFYDKLNSVIPVNTELTYKYADSNDTDKRFAYVTYENVSGWVYLDMASEAVAKKENGKIIVINPNNIELKESIYGNKIENTIKEDTVLEYEYFTKYQYNVTYEGKSLWLSINGNDAIAHEATVDSINVFKDEKVYSKPNTLKHVYEFKEDTILEPLFFYNGFYYIETEDTKGWVNKEDALEDGTSKIDLTKREVVEEPIEPEVPEKKPGIKPEIIVIAFLGILLLVSLTSLIGVVIMNKKGIDLVGESTPNTSNAADDSTKSE